MQRIDSDGAVAGLPDPEAEGATVGYFDPGDPGVGQRATVVSYDFMNALQETVIDPIEDRGITLKKTSPYDLLTQAIKAIVAETGGISGLRMTYSAGVFAIKGEDGNNLSATNFGFVPCASTTVGKKKALKMTANATFQDAAGTSDLTNFEAGIVSSADWASDMPWFLYSVNVGDTDIDGVDGHSCLAISRNFAMGLTPSSVNDIWTTAASASNDTQKNIMLLGGFTAASYVSKPCQLIGTFRMRYAVATHDWTVQDLGTTDGLGPDQIRKTFAVRWTFPLGQNGAAAGTYLAPNGGTAPVFTTNIFFYTITPDGWVNNVIGLTGDAGTDGSGAVAARLQTPYANFDASNTLSTSVLSVLGNSVYTSVIADINNADSSLTMNRLVDGTAVLNSFFANGNRHIGGAISFKAF